MNPLLLTDFYKIGHPFQYPTGTEFVYSNSTARKSRFPDIPQIVFFGLQYFIKRYLGDGGVFDKHFFFRPHGKVMDEYIRMINKTIGPLKSYEHISDLHHLGYLPLKIQALPEGTLVPMRVPYMTIYNTLKEFYWLTNFFETLISASIWQAITSATIAYEYRKRLNRYAKETGVPDEFVQWQGHDFSFRGMSSLESAVLSGMGHLLSFTGTDTIPAIMGLEKYYNADIEKELVGGSVPATEHSVMCAGTKEGERETFHRLLTEVYPSGILSVVSDSYDLWKVCTETLRELKDVVMNRDGKLVIRPDSGDPVKIICGDPDFPQDDPRHKGVVELLWDIFGGTTTAQGYRMLDSHIGVIYGDSITLSRMEAIAEQLKAKRFANQVVLGIGSYTYQYNTRDTFGQAIKATFVEINGKSRNIFKCPVTDDGTKNSACGLLKVYRENGVLKLKEQCDSLLEDGDELQTVFCNGRLTQDWTLAEIRKNLWERIPHNPMTEVNDLRQLAE